MSGRDSQSTVVPNEDVILPYAEMVKKAERDGVDIMVYVNTMHAHVVSQRRELAKLNKQNAEMRKQLGEIAVDALQRNWEDIEEWARSVRVEFPDGAPSVSALEQVR